MRCYDREILSRYQDGSLRDAESRRIAAHLDGCASCRETLRSLGRAGLFLRIAVGSHKAKECLSEEELGAYVAGVLRAQDRDMVERHLLDCRRCLHEVAVLSDDAALTPGAESPAPDAKAMERFLKLAPAPERRARRFAPMPWLVGAGLAAAVIAAAFAGWHFLSVATPGPSTMTADWRPPGYVTEISYGSMDGFGIPSSGTEMGRFARDAGTALREIERINERPRREAFELLQEDILNSGLVETVSRLRESTREERDRRFLNDCEYVLMQVVKADGRDLDSPDGDLARIVSEIHRLKLTETARLVEMEGSRSQWLAGL